MKPFEKINHALRLLLFHLTLLLTYSIDAASAIGIDYRLDKPHHHPGDAGKPLLVCSNDESYDYTILRAEMSVDDIDTGKFNPLPPPFMASLALLAIYPLAKWRSREAAKMAFTPPPS
jgi:hypothetical protein